MFEKSNSNAKSSFHWKILILEASFVKNVQVWGEFWGGGEKVWNNLMLKGKIVPNLLTGSLKNRKTLQMSRSDWKNKNPVNILGAS